MDERKGLSMFFKEGKIKRAETFQPSLIENYE
jgi:hypothetical protein